MTTRYKISEIILKKKDDKSLRKQIKIRHKETTSDLAEVGLSLWKSSLLLCDYILSNPDNFEGSILELGCGVGLCGMACMLTGNVNVEFSDISMECLENCKINVLMNFPKIEIPNFRVFDVSRGGNEGGGTVDMNLYNIFIGSDILYDSPITQGLIMLLRRMKEKHIFYGAFKRRFNFHMDEHKRLGNVYDEVDEFLIALEDTWAGNKFVWKKIIHIPQFLDKHLEDWNEVEIYEIKVDRSHGKKRKRGQCE